MKECHHFVIGFATLAHGPDKLLSHYHIPFLLSFLELLTELLISDLSRRNPLIVLMDLTVRAIFQ